MFARTGVLWHQGESDTRDLELAESYGQRLTHLIGNLREDLAAPYLPFLIGELGHWLLAEPAPDGKGGMHGAHTHHAMVSAQQRGVAETVSDCVMVSAAGLEDRGDHVHFTTEGYKQFGARYAAQWLRLQPAQE